MMWGSELGKVGGVRVGWGEVGGVRVGWGEVG